jgi:hypothetical protein
MIDFRVGNDEQDNKSLDFYLKYDYCFSYLINGNQLQKSSIEASSFQLINIKNNASLSLFSIVLLSRSRLLTINNTRETIEVNLV